MIRNFTDNKLTKNTKKNI